MKDKLVRNSTNDKLLAFEKDKFSSVYLLYLHGSVLVSAYPKKISLKNFFMIAFVSSQTVYI